MNKKRSDKKIYFTAFLVCVLLLAGSVLLTYNIATGGDDSLAAIGQVSRTGKVQFQVVDGFSDEPVKDATVVLLDTGKEYITDDKGMTQPVEVPIIDDKRFNSIMPKTWGEVSAVIYKKGYVPYALFYLEVFPDKTRKGVKILIFKEGEITNDQPFSIIEGPNRIWVNDVIKKYTPKDLK